MNPLICVESVAAFHVLIARKECTVLKTCQSVKTKVFVSNQSFYLSKDRTCFWVCKVKDILHEQLFVGLRNLAASCTASCSIQPFKKI